MDFEYLQDLDEPIENKIKFILSSNDKDLFIEQLRDEYEVFQSSTFEDILALLIINSDVPYHLKYSILDTLYQYMDDKKNLEVLLKTFIPTDSVREFQVVVWLLSLGGEEYIPRLNKYLTNPQIEDKVRYSQLLSLKDKGIKMDYIVKGAEYFFFQPISSRYKILCGQFLLENKTKLYLNVMTELFTIARNESEEYNIKADAADAIHHYGSNEVQDEALVILKALGGKAKTMYENKQNIHFIDISDSLHLLEMYTPKDSYSEIADKLKEMAKQMDLAEQEKKGKKNGKVKEVEIRKAVSGSLGRILLDVACYGKEKWTAENILERVWVYIQNSEFKSELEKRLIQELCEMSDTCSSGHAIRLVNVLSGYGGNVKITFEDQIVGNFSGRVLFHFRQIKDETEREKVILEMPERGPTFRKYYIKYIPLVIKEMREEFVPVYMSDEDFDVCLRKAISVFEGIEQTN